MQKALTLFKWIGDREDIAPALANLGSLVEKRGDDIGALSTSLKHSITRRRHMTAAALQACVIPSA